VTNIGGDKCFESDLTLRQVARPDELLGVDGLGGVAVDWLARGCGQPPPAEGAARLQLLFTWLWFKDTTARY
jgi:hypothetical protein